MEIVIPIKHYDNGPTNSVIIEPNADTVGAHD